jgi:phospholipase C
MSKLASPTRRHTLQGLGAAALWPLTGCGKPGDDTGLDTRTLEDLIREKVDTVVVLMFENRSFDHLMGALTLEEGRDDIDGLTADMSNPHPDGTEVVVYPAGVECLLDPPHSWNASHAQFNDGHNDGFVTEYYGRNPSGASEVMGYWNRDMIGALYPLADAYTLCDQWFCSLMSSTWPNRFYSHAATNGGELGNSLPAEAFDNIYSRLAAGGWTWGCYYPLAPFMVLLPGIGLGDSELQIVEAFFLNAKSGTLPNVCIVEPMFGYNDDHPPNHPKAAQTYLSTIYEALAQSPQWGRTVFIITYDEHGGFYDHVPPPTTPDDHADTGHDQLGFRVPSLLVGPWVKPGHVSHDVFDHTCILAFLSMLFGTETLTKRDKNALALLDCFDEQAMRSNTPLAPITIPPIVATEEELYNSECVSIPGFATDNSPARAMHQPELEAYLDEHLLGTRLDRRAQAPEIYAFLLAKAEELGVLKRA